MRKIVNKLALTSEETRNKLGEMFETDPDFFLASPPPGRSEAWYIGYYNATNAQEEAMFLLDNNGNLKEGVVDVAE